MLISMSSMYQADLIDAKQYVAGVRQCFQDMVSVCTWIQICIHCMFLSAAELYIRGDRAYLLRLGINPQVRHRVCESTKPHATIDN